MEAPKTLEISETYNAQEVYETQEDQEDQNVSRFTRPLPKAMKAVAIVGSGDSGHIF